jgi:hypothetical protein
MTLGWCCDVMTARDKFAVNQTVVATPRFFAKHRRSTANTPGGQLVGIVRGFSVSGQGVRVQIQGQTSVYRYPMAEWEPVREDVQ